MVNREGSLLYEELLPLKTETRDENPDIGNPVPKRLKVYGPLVDPQENFLHLRLTIETLLLTLKRRGCSRVHYER